MNTTDRNEHRRHVASVLIALETRCTDGLQRLARAGWGSARHDSDSRFVNLCLSGHREDSSAPGRTTMGNRHDSHF